MNRYVGSNSYISGKGKGSHCVILDLKTSNNLLLFLTLGTKNHTLGAK